MRTKTLDRPTERIMLVMVGLPARGKTYMARKMARYLTWLGHRARVFNVGNYRRRLVGSRQPHRFFDPGNPDGFRVRREMAKAALDDSFAWLDQKGGGIAIYDATNSTRERRLWISEHCRTAGIQVVFIESVCNVAEIIQTNVQETKLLSPDYEGVEEAEAASDFRSRISHYERAYQPLEPSEGSCIKLIDVGRQVVLHDLEGYLLGHLAFFLMNLHITPRPIWLTRHGESLDNLRGRIGGDSDLSPRGQEYSKSLARFMKDRTGGGEIRIWTSTLRRTIQTASSLEMAARGWKALDEIDAGVCDGMTYAEIEAQMPEEFSARAADKLRYRYPQGESYVDVIGRLDPLIIELERQRTPLLVIGHNAVMRTLYAYFHDHTAGECPHLDFPLHTVIELTPKAYGCQERRYELEPRL